MPRLIDPRELDKAVRTKNILHKVATTNRGPKAPVTSPADEEEGQPAVGLEGTTRPAEQADTATAAEGFAMIKPDSKGAIALMEALKSRQHDEKEAAL